MQTNAQRKTGNNLRNFRQAQGLTLYGLAALAGVSPTTLSAIEKWNYQPTVRVRERIVAALGVQVRDIWPDRKERARESAR